MRHEKCGGWIVTCSEGFAVGVLAVTVIAIATG